MPLYDYRCTQCGHQVEVMHPIGGAGPETCERCGGAMRKALSPPAIHFKGSGWAKKDARSASTPKGTEQAKTDVGGGEGKAAASGGEKGAGSSDAGGGSTTSDGPAKAASGTASD